MDFIAHAIIRQAGREGLLDRLASMKAAGTKRVARTAFHGLWAQHGSIAMPDTLYDTLCDADEGVPVDTLIHMGTHDTTLRPGPAAMCVGFSPLQREDFLRYCREHGFGPELSIQQFYVAFVDARGFPPAEEFVRTISARAGTIKAAEFAAMCTIDPASPSAVPFPVYHARRQLQRQTAFVGLTLYLPFLVLLTVYVTTGRHYQTARDAVAAIDEVMRTSTATGGGTSSAQCGPTCDKPDNMFDDVYDRGSFFDWLEVSVAALWQAAAAPNGTALGLIERTNLPLGALRIRASRFETEDASLRKDMYDGRAASIPLEEPVADGEPSAMPQFRYARASARKTSVADLSESMEVAAASTGVALASFPGSLFSRAAADAIRYRSCAELNGSVSYTGAVTRYGCGGHAVDIPFSSTAAEAVAVVRALRNSSWLGGDVGAVFIEFFTVNFNELSFVHTAMFQEVQPGGRWSGYHMLTHSDIFDFRFKSLFLVAVATAVAVSSLVYLVHFLHSLHVAATHRRRAIGADGINSYLVCVPFAVAQDLWNFADMLLLALLLAGSATRWASILLLVAQRQDDESGSGRFYQADYYPPRLERVADLQVGAGYLEAMVIIVAYLRALRYFGLYRPVRMIFDALIRSAIDLTGTAFAFVILFFSFTASAYAAYGYYLADFESFESAGSSLLRAIVGDVDYMAMRQVHPIFTPVFFSVFFIIISLVALNMIIAVLTGAFEETHAHLTGGFPPSYVASADASCYLAPERRSLLGFVKETAIFTEISFRVRGARRVALGKRWYFGWHRNPRLLYADLDDVFTGLYFGSTDLSTRALCTLSKEARRWAPHFARNPMPTFERPVRREEGSADFEGLIRSTLPAEADFLLLALVWVPARVLGTDPLGLLDELISDFGEWRQTVEPFAYIDGSGPAEEPAPFVAIEGAAKLRAHVGALVLADSNSIDAPAEAIRRAADELTWCGGPSLPLRSAPVLDADWEQPWDPAAVAAAKKRQDEQAVVSDWSSDSRAMFGQVTRRSAAGIAAVQSGDAAEDIALATPSWCDSFYRVSGCDPRTEQLRKLQDEASDATVGAQRFMRRCAESDESVREASFPRFFYQAQRQANDDCLKVWGFLVFLVLFALVLVLDRGLGQGVRTTTAFDAVATLDVVASAADPQRVGFTDVRTPATFYQWGSDAFVLLSVPENSTDGLPRDLSAPHGVRAVGAIKLRQLRSRSFQCNERPIDVPVPSGELLRGDVQRHLDDGCAGGPTAFETAPRAVLNSSEFNALPQADQDLVADAFKFRTAPELQGFGTLLTPDALHLSNGYGVIVPLNESAAVTTRRFDLLAQFGWVDDFTRAVILDVVTFVPHADLVVHSSYVLQMPRGGAWQNHAVHTPFRPYGIESTPWGISLLMFVFVVALLWYTQLFFMEFEAAFTRRSQQNPNAAGPVVVLEEFFSTYWWPVDLVRYLIFVATWILRSYMLITGLGDINVSRPGAYPSSAEPLARISTAVLLLDCANFVLCGAKVLFYVRSMPDLAVFTATIERSWRNLLSLIVALAVLLLAFAVAGFSLFGEVAPEFSTFDESFSALLRVASLESFGDDRSLHDQNRLTYALFFIAFVFIINAVMLNLFIAVLTNGFMEVKAEVFHDEHLMAVMSNDPIVAFAGVSVMQRVWRSALVQELRFWVRRALLACRGPSDPDAWEEAHTRIAMANPRLFFDFMSTRSDVLETGAPAFALGAALEIVALMRLLGVTADARDVDDEGDTDTAPQEPAAVPPQVHGYPRRTTHAYLSDLLGGDRDEALLMTVVLPSVALSRGWGECLADSLGVHFTWKLAEQAGIAICQPEASDVAEQEAALSARVDALLY